MKTAKFSLPWRILALLTPVMALLAALIVANEPRSTVQEQCAVFFSVLAAANGYLCAVASGDFGRSVLAIPLGIVSGLAAGYGALSPFMPLFALVTLFVYTRWLAFYDEKLREGEGAASGCLYRFQLFFLAWLYVIVVYGLGQDADEAFGFKLEHPTGLPLAVVFIACCGASSMSLDHSCGGVKESVLIGFEGVVFGSIGYMIALAFCYVIEKVIAFQFGTPAYTFVLPAHMFSIVMGNYCCIWRLFGCLARVESDREPEPEPEPEPETASEHESA